MKFNFQTSLAKLMAREDITVIPTSHKTAYFDVKNRTLGIPNWKGLHELELELLIGHEIGHALYTNCVEFESALNSFRKTRGAKYFRVFKDYINIVEDARIESLVKEKYPGMKKIFYYGYSRIANRDIFNVTQDNIETLNPIDYINAYFKFNGVFTFNPKPNIAPFIDKISKVVTFDDVVRVSYELFEAFLKKSSTADSGENKQENNRGRKEQSQQAQPESEDSTEEKSESEASPAPTDSEETTEEKSATEDSAEEKSDPVGSGPDGSANDPESTVASVSDSESENKRPEELVSQTAKKLNEFLEDSSDSTELTIISNPIPNLDAIIHSHKKIIDDMERINPTIKSKEKVSKDTRDSINQIKRVFEMRKKASEYNRTNTHKAGKLDTNKIHSYKYNDEIFKSFQSTNSGKNHGLIFFLDMSSSMHNCIKQVIEKMIELVVFCREAGIKYEVYGFSNNPHFEHEEIPKFSIDNAINYSFASTELTLIELFNDTMTTSTFNKMISIVRSQIGLSSFKCKYVHLQYLQLNSTPLDLTIMCLNKMIDKFRGRTNSQMVNVIFLTDGGSSGSLSLIDKNNRKTYIGGSNKDCVMVDTHTKKTYDVGAVNCRSSSDIVTRVTSIQLKMVKDRNPGVNIINFFLTPHLPRNDRGLTITQKQYDEFYEHRTPVIVDNHNGFDRVFFINSRLVGGNIVNNLKTASTNLTDIKEKFQRMQKNNKTNKFLISSFVDMII